MRKLIAGLLKNILIFVIILALVGFVGYKFRSQTLPLETMLRPTVNKLFIMAGLQEDTTGVGLGIDTTLTAEEELRLQIDNRMNQLSLRSSMLDSIEQNIGLRQDSLEIQKQQLVTRQGQLTVTQNTNLAKLALLYNNMVPQQAAQILLQLPDQTAVEILYRMTDREAGKVIEALGDPVRAADILKRYQQIQTQQ